jgi:hypothetical protein
MKNLFNYLFNRWTKWELDEEDVPYTCSVYNSPILGGGIIKESTVYFDIYVRENKYNGIKQYRKVRKR